MQKLCVILVAALTATAAPATAKAAECNLRQVAELPVTMLGARHLRPVIAATINGVNARLIFDTGDVGADVFQGSAHRVKLQPKPAPAGIEFRSYGQIIHPLIARAEHLVIGTIDISQVEFTVTDASSSYDIDGFVGLQSMTDLDVEFDLSGGFIRIFKPVGCDTTNLAYWADPVAVSIVTLEPFRTAVRPFGLVKVNGVQFRALFDSGSPDTDLTLVTARRAGVSPGDPDVREAGAMGGLGQGGLKNWQGRFSSLVVGGETIRNLVLNFTDKPNASADLIIGADYFVTHRILISKSQGKLYATPVGGGGLAAQPQQDPQKR